MVHVPVEDHHALDAVGFDRVTGGERRVVEQAEAHRRARLGVVTRRPVGAEPVGARPSSSASTSATAPPAAWSAASNDPGDDRVGVEDPAAPIRRMLDRRDEWRSGARPSACRARPAAIAPARSRASPAARAPLRSPPSGRPLGMRARLMLEDERWCRKTGVGALAGTVLSLNSLETESGSGGRRRRAVHRAPRRASRRRRRTRVGGPLAGASSYWAQGGLAAALASDDSPERHLADTVAAGRGACGHPPRGSCARRHPTRSRT